MEYADLHIHSTYSDGKLSIEEIIQYALEINLKGISITDHDTIDGLLNVDSLEKSSLDILPGIELSTTYNNEEIHILGYCIDIDNKSLASLLESLQNTRYKRAIKLVENLNKIGLNISSNDINGVYQGKSIGRPHIAQIIVNKGYAANYDEAFKTYLMPGTPSFVSRFKLETAEAIRVIKLAGGIPVLAHPGLIKNQLLINDVIDLGIDGIEVYHTIHTPHMVRGYYSIAKEKKLLITGGSDCHSDKQYEKPFIGSTKIPYVYVEELKASLGIK